MKELRIFVDKSGIIADYNPQYSPYYIASIVFHNQSNNINNDLQFLETSLTNLGFPYHCIHCDPLIKSEEKYKYLPIKKRERILNCKMILSINQIIH